MRIRIVPAVAALAAACGGARHGPPSGALEKAVTTVVPDGEKCPDPVGDTRAVVIAARAGDARLVGRVTATRFHSDEDDACTWAEDGAASAARRLGADLVVVTSRREGEDGDHEKCTVEVRAYVRGTSEFLRPCTRETIRGVEGPGDEPAPSAPED